MKYLIIAPVLVVTAAVLAPASTSEVVGKVGNFFETITVQDCESNPKACLEVKERELKRLEAKLSGSDRNLAVQLRNVREVRDHNTALVEANAIFLEKGRTILNTALPNQPIIWLGKRYETQDDFKAQLSILYAEKIRLIEVGMDSETLIENLSKMRERLISRRSEVASAIAVLPAKYALLETHMSLAGLEEDLSQIDGVIKNANTSAQDVETILRSTEELVMDSRMSGEPAKANADFEAWLNDRAG